MNCIIIDDDPIIQKQLAVFIRKSELLDIKGSFKNPTEAFQTLRNGDIDIVFLDIEMPEMSGLEFLDEAGYDFTVIIISGDRKYALDTFEYDVTDYLLKPVEYSRFIKAVNRAIERNLEVNKTKKSDWIFIKSLNSFVRLSTCDIISIKCNDDTITIVTKRKSYTVLSKFFDISFLTEKENFYKINDSLIVNLNEISEVCDNCLIFKNQHILEQFCVDELIANDISNRLIKIKA